MPHTPNGLPAARRLVVAAAIVDDLATPTMLLAAQRSTPADLAGMWEFPGGKVDPGETPHQALHRELYEELGVHVELGAEFAGPDDGGWVLTDQLTMRLWFARIIAGDPQPLAEHSALRWLPAGSWFDVAWLAADVRVVTEMVRRADNAR